MKRNFWQKPIARYDTETKKVYVEYADGEKICRLKKMILVLADPNGSGKSSITKYYE